MKLKRIYPILLFVLIIVISKNAIEVNAMKTGFSTEELSEEKKTIFVTNINIVPLSAEPPKKSILCFDVNEQGMIAVGQKNSQRKEICVYTSRGEFLYGYSFNCTQSFCVEWDERNINVYFIRSDVIISLDSNGNILDIKTVQDTIDNNSYRNSLLYSTTRTVGSTTYLIRNNMGIFNWLAPSFSQIVIIDATGTESIIYDVNSNQFTKIIVTISFISVFILIAIVVVFLRFIKFEHSN